MLYLTCTIISRVDLAHYGVSRAKDWDLWIVLQLHLNHQKTEVLLISNTLLTLICN